ncbi:MAG: ferritin-like domain-containing protein, partial [Duganella sp.]
MAESNPTHPAGIDIEAIRTAARNLEDGPVTAGYKGDREAVIKMLNDALATEMVCVMRYKRHYYTVSG